jgi:hypothetical protein
MKKSFLFLSSKTSILISMLILFTQMMFAGVPLANFNGTWTNINAASRGIVKVEIAISGTNATAQVWGSCSPTPCDWGIKNGVAYSNNATTAIASNTEAISAVFSQGFATSTVIIKPKGANQIEVTHLQQFTDGSGRNNYIMIETFAKSTAQKPCDPEDCISFNPQTVTYAPFGSTGQYRMIDGNMAMVVFPNKAEAVRAVEIVKNYGMSSQCFVGRPNASFTYWLTGGNAPTGSLAGEDCIDFNPNTIEVKQVSGSWKIVDGTHWLFDFGKNEAEARQSFCLIKKHGFTKTCYVGRPNASMTYLKK